MKRLSLFLIVSLFFFSLKGNDTIPNLLDNPGAENNFTGWTRSDGGTGWAAVAAGSHNGSKCWSSSYDPCTLSQTIDLIAKGYTTAILDSAPTISAGTYVTTNYFSSGIITIKVDLLNAANGVISTHYISNNQTIDPKKWILKFISIHGYSIGLRKIRFTMIGEGTLYWEGQYGPSFDDAFVYIITNAKALNDDATNIVPRSATLNGVVYAHNLSTKVTFEYGNSIALGSSVLADQSPIAGTSQTLVSKTIAGLFPNKTYYARVCAISSKDSSYSEIRTIKTPAVILSSSPTTIGIGDTTGNTATINISSNISWTATDNASWLTISPTSSIGSATMTLSVTQTNPTMDPRIASITLVGDTVPNVVVTVTQAKGSINLKSSVFNIDSDADTLSTKVMSLFKWAAVSNSSWIKVSPDSVNGSANLSFIVTENAGSGTRTGTIILSNSKISNTITINQAKGVITFTPANSSISADAKTHNITVGTNFRWAASTNTPWITVAPDSVSGTSNLSFFVTENNTGVIRAGTIVVSNSRISGTLTVTQGILKGSGTAISPYLISDYTGLKTIKNNLTAYYQLSNDIDASASVSDNSSLGFEPIGNSTTPFIGNFNGAGYSIKTLCINRSNGIYIGLFGSIKNAAINNLGLRNCNIKGYYEVGAIIGSSATSTINNCFVSGSIKGEEYIGGIAGLNSGSTITRSFTTTNVSGTSNVGGLVGYNSGSPINNSYATGNVSGSYYVGGLVGENASSAITNCFSIGKVTSSSSKGGLVGYNMSGTITNSYYNRLTARQTDTNKGTPKSTAQMKVAATFTGWDFTNVWFIRADSTYPGLRNLNNAPFAFPDTIKVKGDTLITSIFENDFDVENIKSNLVFKIDKLYSSGTLSNTNLFSFSVGTAYGKIDSIYYKAGEVMAAGDTLWGNTAVVILKKVLNTPVVALHDTISIFRNDSLKISLTTLLTNTNNLDGNTFTFSNKVAGYPHNGTSIFTNDTINYIPKKGWNGIDTLLFVVTDGQYIDTTLLTIIVVAIPVITWANPADITYNTELSISQLNATVDVPGTLTYNHDVGTRLNAGPGQILSVDFIPENPIICKYSSKTVTINVLKALPGAPWNNPMDITYGKALSETELVARMYVPGTITYNPPAGTVLNAGIHQPVLVTLNPEDQINYENVIDTLFISVNKARLNATANNQTMVQGSTIPELSITYDNFVNGDKPSDLDNVPIATTLATSSSEVGDYYITVSGGSDNNYDFQYSDGILSISINTLLSTTETGSVSVYPNPFTDNFTVRMEKGKTGIYKLTSIIGNTIEQGTIRESNTNIKVPQLKNGVYILNIWIDGKIHSFSIIKQ